ncbi:MAG: o-succinylbenzoate synthase [Balneolaceae bacterium]
MVSLHSFQLPFKKPFITGKETFMVREGIIIRFQDDTVDAISEASPLPGFSVESLDEVQRFLIENSTSLNTFFETDFTLDDLHQKLSSLPNSPSLQFALSTLGIEIICQRRKITLSDLFDQPFNSSIQINAVIGAGSATDLANQIQSGIKDGFTVFKVKVGSELHHLPKTLSTLYKQFPDISFRLDANGSWPLNKVSEFSDAFKNLPIEYIEEPANYQSDEELEKIIQKCSLPVALDESLKDIESLLHFSSNEKIAAFVIKPQLFGSILNLFVTFQRRNHLIHKCVFTTLLESVIGRNIVGLMAGLMGSSTKAHGLHTGTLFDEDIASNLPIKNDRFITKPSIGFGLRFKDLNQNLTKLV